MSLSQQRRRVVPARRGLITAVAALVAELFGVEADWESFIRCNHNHVRRETHFGQPLWTHRKGAISAQLGATGELAPWYRAAAGLGIELRRET